MSELEREILRYALLNAVRHEGKAEVGAVLKRLLGAHPELRGRVRDILPLVREVVKRVNSMGPDEQRRELEEMCPEALVKERGAAEEKRLPPLPDVDKYPMVVTRFAPNPDFVLHLGSARPAIINYEYARMYRGKFILRFEDTDPKTKTPIPEAYDLIREDLEWLGVRWDEEHIQSLRMEIYYDYARRLIKDGKAYVCTCSPERIRKLRGEGKRCECFDLSVEDHLERWERMVEGEYGEQGAVLRIVTDIKHPDPAVRDWIAFRVIDTKKHPHPLVGDRYCAWPTYNFACAIDDCLMKVSHVLRGREHYTNTVKQQYIFRYLGARLPTVIHFGRLNLEGAVLSKSVIRRGISEGLYRGWDDPRLPTLIALRRRGILPEAIRELIIDVGVKPSPATISLVNLYAINRKYLEPRANRYMFVPNPCELHLLYEDGLTARIPYHPSYPERGFREIRLESEGGIIRVAIPGSDAKDLRVGTEIRLLGLANVRVVRLGPPVEATLVNVSSEYAKERGLRIIQWAPPGGVNVRVVVPEGEGLRTVEGVAEPRVADLRIGDQVQFFRFGFVKLEEVSDGGLLFLYTHD